MLLQSQAARAGALEPLWRREEALAAVQGVVLLDAPMQVHGKDSSEEGDARPEGWAARMGGQLEDAQDAAVAVVGAVEGLASVPAKVAEVLLTIVSALEHTFPLTLLTGKRGPPPTVRSRDVRVTLSPDARAAAQAKARRFGFDKVR